MVPVEIVQTGIVQVGDQASLKVLVEKLDIDLELTEGIYFFDVCSYAFRNNTIHTPVS